MDQSGTVDFYPNGGESQPGCSPATFDYTSSSTLTNLENLVACSHMRSISLFNDALLSNNCQSIGYQCNSIDDFNQVRFMSPKGNYNLSLFTNYYVQGKCTSCGTGNTQCAVFGMGAALFPSRSLTGVKLYFNTASQTPYCCKVIKKLELK